MAEWRPFEHGTTDAWMDSDTFNTPSKPFPPIALNPAARPADAFAKRNGDGLMATGRADNVLPMGKHRVFAVLPKRNPDYGILSKPIHSLITFSRPCSRRAFPIISSSGGGNLNVIK